MKRKVKNNFLKFGLLSVFLSGTLISIPFITDSNHSTDSNNSTTSEKSNNITEKSKEIEGENLAKQLNEKYVEKNKIYTVSEAKEIINKLDENQIKILKQYTEAAQEEFNNKSQKDISDTKSGELSLSEKSYSLWYWCTLTVHWDVQESKNISNILSLVSIGMGVASLADLEIPGLDVVLGISSLVTSGLSFIFGNPGRNGVKLDLLFGFLPIYFGAY